MFFKKSPATSHQLPATLLIGLGNPGAEYEGNRHNIGLMAVQKIADDYGFSKWQKKFSGALCEGVIDGKKIHAFLPLTYMNLSGEPTQKAAQFFKLPAEQMLVIHDELDLPLGSLRIKRGGGAGGHNGLKSLDAHLGKEYQRIRLGIGHPGDKNLVSDYVLSDFAKSEKPLVESLVEAVSKHLPILLKGDEAGFMNKVTNMIKPVSERGLQ